ncbi:iron-containing alcohol dehydrogenase [Brachyspira hyodysenteriae]|nr:iron-containing alcohol dehydrogenase [Brachyspira hyodysenteriae]MDA1470236.1 iron-containing alcohol dehydrogenase [Brachyspira hyodysenteriae]
MAANDGDYWDYIFGGTGKGKAIPNDPLPVVAITTTAGTGTEADPWTVITNGNEKIGFGYEKTYPYLSIVGPGTYENCSSKTYSISGF